MSEVSLSKTEVKKLEDGIGNTFKIKLHNGNKKSGSQIVKLIDSKENSIYAIPKNSQYNHSVIDVTHGDPIMVAYAEGGPDKKSEDKKEGYFNPGNKKYSGFKESVTWSYDYWIISVEEI